LKTDSSTVKLIWFCLSVAGAFPTQVDIVSRQMKDGNMNYIFRM